VPNLPYLQGLSWREVVMRTFSRKELTKYSGKDSTPVYIAYEGLVYNVSDSFLW
jgi:hypothetical protein